MGCKIIKFTVLFGQLLVYKLDMPQDYRDQSQYVTLWCHQTLNIPEKMMMMMTSGSSCHNIVNEYKYYFSYLTTTPQFYSWNVQNALLYLILELYSWFGYHISYNFSTKLLKIAAKYRVALTISVTVNIWTLTPYV